MWPQAREDKLLVQAVDEEMVVYDQETHEAHRLNPTAALVWRHCDGQTSVAELGLLLERELNLPADEELIWLALNQLEKVNLLRESLEHMPPRPSISRREVMRRLALAGALTLLLPVVNSIVAPTPAMAQYTCSDVTILQTCQADCFLTDCDIVCPPGTIPRCRCVVGFARCSCRQVTHCP